MGKGRRLRDIDSAGVREMFRDDPLQEREARERPRVALCMIVRDEAHIIPRLVASVKDHVDYYVVVDTGSIDGTQDLLVAQMEWCGIPGELHERKWVDFGHNRSEMLALARYKADWLLLMDADWTLEVDGEVPLVRSLPSKGDGFWVMGAGDLGIAHKVILNGDLPWHAVGPVHEHIECLSPFVLSNITGVRWLHHADSGTRDTRAEGDEAALRAAIEADPTDTRSVFYLAQTLKDMGGREVEALDWYMRRREMGGWEDEVFYATYQAGMCASFAGWSVEHQIGLLMAAWAMCPQRVEPLYEVVWRLRTLGRHEAIDHLLGPYVLAWRHAPEDGLFVHRWVWDWGMTFEYALMLQNTGRLGQAAVEYGYLLTVESFPHREDAERNLAICGAAA